MGLPQHGQRAAAGSCLLRATPSRPLRLAGMIPQIPTPQMATRDPWWPALILQALQGAAATKLAGKRPMQQRRRASVGAGGHALWRGQGLGMCRAAARPGRP